MKKREKWKKITSHHWPKCAKWISRYSISRLKIWARWTSPFCRFSASFSLNYDVTDAILQHNEKIKQNISGVLCLICLKLCRLLGLSKAISLHLKFCCYGNQNQNDVYYWKTKGLLFKQKCFSKNNLKQYSFIANACCIIFLKKKNLLS